MSTYRILIVDDDPFFLRVYSDFLRSRGFEVESATDGEAALHVYAAGRYQLVVVDLVMPGISGIDLIERIRSISPAQDFIVVTGTEDVRTAVRAMRLGVYDYLVKPIEREELLMIIDRLQERATLYDEHARLLDENIHFAEVQQIYQRGLRIMQSLDLETVCERLLETLSEVCGAQGAALWLGRDDGSELSLHGYRGLIEAAALPMSWTPERGLVGRELGRGSPMLAFKRLDRLEYQSEPAEALLCPLTREGRVVGLVQLVEKLGGGFGAKDVAHAGIIGECATTAVQHAWRYRQLERVGLRDAATAAYNMTYFVDYLGRELHKARRYGRSFALVQMHIDNLPTLRQSLRSEVLREALRRLVLAVSSSLRDIDVLARVTDEEMYVLLPETDFLGGLGFARTAREAIQRNPFLADIDRQHPIAVSFGPAAFPRDGDDVDQLFAACRRRLDEAQRSLFRRLHLEDVDFWGAADLLIGGDDAYAQDVVQRPGPFGVTEDALGISRHQVFPRPWMPLLYREVLGEAARQPKTSGWLFLAGGFANGQLAAPTELGQLRHDGMRVYLLGSTPPERLGEVANVTPVRVGGTEFDRHEVVLFLAEHASYGLLARRADDGALRGFHTADWTLIEGLIAKLQDAYNLQRGAP